MEADPGPPPGEVIHFESGRPAPRDAVGVVLGSDRDRCGSPRSGAQAEAVQAASPRARDESMTGSARCDAARRGPPASPVTMPRSTVGTARGCARAAGKALPNGHSFGHHGRASRSRNPRRGPRIRAPSSVSATTCMAARMVRLALGRRSCGRRQRTPVLLARRGRPSFPLRQDPAVRMASARSRIEEVVGRRCTQPDGQILLNAEELFRRPSRTGCFPPALDP